MPTILRFRGFTIEFYVSDHSPAHVHAKGRDVEAIFQLKCAGGAVTLRESNGTTAAEEAALARFITDNRNILCKACEEIHGDAAGA
ncbi:MAG TPA: DUF4160 domain-containing protein [Acidobacteriaceae bacterium]|nr:DUF4160 domain-containing protein [Acidobacteriaceae bacterium]